MARCEAKRVNIVTLKMVKEASFLYGQRQINSPLDAADMLKPFLAEEDRETFIVLCLDTKNQPTSLQTVSIGSLNCTLVHPREIFKLAILSNANALILSHNHPSGDSTPSREDIEITKRLQQAGELLGIEVLDHIILTSEGYCSLKEQALIDS